MNTSEPPRLHSGIMQMIELAATHGYVCQPMSLWSKEIGTSIAARMVPRLGDQVYQMFAYNIPVRESITEETETVTTWTFKEVATLTCHLRLPPF